MLQAIIRVFDNNIEEMKGFQTKDFTQTLQHIAQELFLEHM